jgi:hypothetical protein
MSAPSLDPIQGAPGTGATAGAVTWRSIICKKLSGAINTFRDFIKNHIIGKSLTDREAALDPAPQESGPTGADNISSLIDQPKQLVESLMNGQQTLPKLDGTQCFLLANTLLKAKAGKEGATLLAKLLVDDKLQGFNLSEYQCNKLAEALNNDGQDDIELLQKLLDGGKLKNLDPKTSDISILIKLDLSKLEQKQCNALVMRLISGGKEDVGSLKTLLNENKLKQFRLLGCDDHKTSKIKALYLLNKNTPEALTGLRSLIDIGLNGLIYMAKSNITKLRELIVITKLINLIDKARSNITELKKLIGKAELKKLIIDATKSNIAGLKDYISIKGLKMLIGITDLDITTLSGLIIKARSNITALKDSAIDLIKTTKTMGSTGITALKDSVVDEPDDEISFDGEEMNELNEEDIAKPFDSESNIFSEEFENHSWPEALASYNWPKND